MDMSIDETKQAIWKVRFSILSLDADFMSLAKLSSLSNYFQEAAWQHAGHLGVGYSALTGKNLVWVLSRLRLHIDDYPCWGDEIDIETWPVGTDGLYALRDFTITNPSGKTLVRGSSAWLVLERDTHKLFRHLTPLLQSIPSSPDRRNFSEAIPKLNEIQGASDNFDIKTTYSDLDANCHVNNNRYIGWISDTFDLAFYRQKRIHDLVINYVAETLAEEELVISRIQTGNDTWFLEGKKKTQNNAVVFRSQVQCS